MSKIKNKKNAIFLALAFLSAMFVAQQMYSYVKTGKSCIFTYRGSITPKDYRCIFDEIRYQMFKMMALNDNHDFPDANSLCKVVDGLELDENQPLRNYGIELIQNKETKTFYLYGVGLKSILAKEKYQLCSDKWHVLLLVNKSLSEKPMGIYHSFKLSRDGNHWLSISTQQGINIDSWIPPIPGCFYNVEEKKVYIPPELLPVYEVIYPNLKLPVTSIMESNLSPSCLYRMETEVNQSNADMRTYLCVVAVVKNMAGKVVDKIQTNASDRMTWSIRWGVNDSIILESSDIGIRTWEKTDSDHWKAKE